MKVGIRHQDDVRFYYPDIQVSCEEESDAYYNTSPCLIIEVLSESTARKDRTENLLLESVDLTISVDDLYGFLQA